MMFIARYNDGSCGIAEAEDETKARRCWNPTKQTSIPRSKESPR